MNEQAQIVDLNEFDAVNPTAIGTMAFGRDGADYVLRCKQLVGLGLDEVWPFFSKAENLMEITPDWIRFEILTPTPIEMKVGTLIDYKIGLKGIPMRWRSEISRWEPPHCFADVQVKGPYLKWEHTHVFEPVKGEQATICYDTIRYRVLMPWLTHALLVRPDLTKIFRYRCQAVSNRFSQRRDR